MGPYLGKCRMQYKIHCINNNVFTAVLAMSVKSAVHHVFVSEGSCTTVHSPNLSFSLKKSVEVKD